MRHPIERLFYDEVITKKIQSKLAYLFQMAEIECSRSGKIGMQVGSLRENIINALLAHVYGEENVNTEIPITMPEVDIELYGIPISIKTFTGTAYSGVKISWTVDEDSAHYFASNYNPTCDIIFIRINWGSNGDFCFIPKSTQIDLFHEMGYEKYIKLPRPGTNPRGVEISKDALKTLTEDKDTLKIEIAWTRKDIKLNPYERWIEYWAE